MPKKSKRSSKSGWRDADFHSFWQHYAKVQEWVRLESECRQDAMEDWEWRQAEKQCISLLSMAAAHLGTDLDTAPESVVSTNDGNANANGVEKRTKQGGDGHQIEQEPGVVANAPLNELDPASCAIRPTPWTAQPKRKKRNKKQQQQKKWMKRRSTYQSQEEEEGEWEPDEKLLCCEEEEDSSVDEQMRAFRETTREHRKQWEQKKREERQKERQQNDTDEYFDASKMSFKTIHQQQNAASNNLKQHLQRQQQKVVLPLNCQQSGGASAVAESGADDDEGTGGAKNTKMPVVAAGTAAEGCNDLATRAREYRRQHLYGSDGMAKLDELETKMHAHFEAEFAKHTPDTWPNIPLRF